jgi:hypothetical protein
MTDEKTPKEQFKLILSGEQKGAIKESPIQHGTYEVWLNRGHPPERLAQAAGEEPYPSFPHGYGRFANVRGNSLDHARELMSDMPSIFSNRFREWETESGVQTLLPGVIARDIEVGDVIVTPQGKPYQVERQGFREILDEKTLAPEADRMRGPGQKYEKHLKESTERALARMQEKSGGRER